LKIFTKKGRLSYYIIAFLASGTLYPFIHNFFISRKYGSLISIVFLGLWLFSILLFHKKIIFPNRFFNLIVLIQGIFFLICFSLNYSSNVIIQFSFLVLSYFFIFLCINTFNRESFLNLFIRFNILAGLLSIIGLILVITGFTQVLQVVDYQGDFKLYNYGFFFVKWGEDLVYELRPAGFYDEPGSFAFIVMLLLLINRKFYKNRKYEYLLLLLPLVTTSLAHIFTVILYFIFFYLKRRNTKRLLTIIGLLISLIFIINTFNEKNDFLSFFKRRTLTRFEGFINGEHDASRQGGIELGPEIFLKNPFGISREKVEILYPEFVNETIWGPLIYYGLIGGIIYFLPFISILINSMLKKNRDNLIFVIIVFINLFQRPYYMYPLILLLIYYLFFDNSKSLIINYKYKSF
tara:strand:- start:33065 stop:34282 length:1218 start_codon:yes stop_codon:yes gene_type:complete